MAALTAVAALLLFLGAFPVARAAQDRGFDPADAVAVEAVAAVQNDDVHQAHQQALLIGFRRALSDTIEGMGAGRMEERIPDDPSRYIQAYRVEEQVRQDLFYRLKLLVWVDRRLVRDEMIKGVR